MEVEAAGWGGFEDAGVEMMEVDAAECGVHTGAELLWSEELVVPWTAVAKLAATVAMEMQDEVT